MITRSKNYDKLSKQLQDLEKHLQSNELKVIPIPANSKAPKSKAGIRKTIV